MSSRAVTSNSLFAIATCRTSVLLCCILFLVAGCQDTGLFSPNTRATSRVLLRPFFAVQGGSSAVDVNRIRVTVSKLPENEVVDVEVVDVDPTATAWNLDLEVPANTSLRLLLELMNGETVLYSGVVEVTVTSGEQPTQSSVPVFPGPPENLNITGIAISPRDQTVPEGREFPLTANVVGGPGPNATVTWISLNSSVATVTGTGRNAQVTTRAPGQAVITAVAGRATDNITVTVVARAASLEVTPATATAASLNLPVTFNARVLDPRNAEILGVPVTWSIADATIAAPVSPGVFRALRNGSTTVTATAVHNGQTITGNATLTVDQRAVTIAIDPAEARFTALGQNRRFTVIATDAGGSPIPDCGCWTSSNNAVATVDATGLVTARGVGTATISVQLGGRTAESLVTVVQEAARITLDPTEATLEAINQTTQLNARVEDASGNPIDLPITWSSTVPTVATVDDNGRVTATGDGVTVITAQSGTRRATATIRVERVPRAVVVEPAEVAMDAGTTFQLNGSAVDANGFAIGSVDLVWSSNQPGIASVNTTTGLVSAHGAGEADITAQYGTMSANAHVVVTGTGVGANNGGDLVVLNDINVFDDNAFSRSTDNELFFRNMFANVTTGARAGANKVWFDHGRLSNCVGPCIGLSGFTNALAQDGLVIQYIATSQGTLINIPPDVRAIILWLPNLTYTTAEINSLKAFAAEGGRIVFNGEHGSFYNGFALENSFLESMGSSMRVFGAFVNCNYTDLFAASIRPHAITNGVTSITMGCSSVLELGPNDVPLYVDNGNAGEGYSNGSCHFSCVLAAVTRINTTPIVLGDVISSQRVDRIEAPRRVPPIVPKVPNPKSSTGY
jgi:uncharacterized protein YjdB